MKCTQTSTGDMRGPEKSTHAVTSSPSVVVLFNSDKERVIGASGGCVQSGVGVSTFTLGMYIESPKNRQLIPRSCVRKNGIIFHNLRGTTTYCTDDDWASFQSDNLAVRYMHGHMTFIWAS